jgi:SAM-dependent methyltransferase
MPSPVDLLVGYPFELPRGAEHFLVLQRTSYAYRLPRAARFRPVEGLFRRYGRRPVERLRRRTIAKAYTDELLAEYDQLRPYLPAAAGSLLDVGCGIAGIDALLYRHYLASARPVQVHLLDKEGTSEVYYGFRDAAAFYNSLDLARAFLVANGVADDHVHTFDANATGFPRGTRYDLIISLLSWGHHYPVTTYLDDAVASLADDGVLIMDVRRASSGLEELSDRMTSVEEINGGRVTVRVCARMGAGG